MDSYIFMVMGYAILLGIHNVFRKKATLQHKESVVLVIFTGVCFLLSLIWIPFGINVELKFVGLFALKGLILATAWFFILKVLKVADASLVSLSLVLSSVMTLIAGVIFFGESLNWLQIIGLLIVIGAVVSINFVGGKERKKIRVSHIFLLLLYAILNSMSSIIDKSTASGTEFYQVQFWFSLFLFVFSLVFFGFDCFKSKKFLVQKSDMKSFWIYLVAITLFLGDLLLFLSYRMPNASLMVITVVSKLKTIVGVVAGVLVFKEKNFIAKVIISLICVAGILLVSLG